jgi:GxxExxY protein
MESLRYEKLTAPVIAAAMEVHREVGPGLTKEIYEECLCHELATRGVVFHRHVHLPIHYKKTKLSCDLQMDIVAEQEVILVVEAIERILPIHEAKLATYLKMSGKPIGLLINFNVPALKDGIVRQVR